MQAWLSFLSLLSNSAHKLGHRQVVILSGQQDWGWQLLAPWLAKYENNALISRDIPENIPGKALATNKPSNLLGYESDNIVFNCHQGLYPDALTAISGTLVCGGIFFLLCPDIDLWPQYPDDFAKNRAPHQTQPTPTANNFNMIKRLLHKAKLHGVKMVRQNDDIDKLTLQSTASEGSWHAPTGLTSDQKKTLDKISDHFTDPSYTHVITADRGRGKSHLLGNLLVKLENLNIDNGIMVYLTAPTKNACHAIYKVLEQAGQSGHRQYVKFIPPEQLLQTGSANDIVFVDEAASLPINLLIQYSNQFNKLILATTTHGYEGTGKGFQIRFFNHLNTLGTSHKVYQHALSNAVRYANTDPLEHWLFDTFCLDCEPKGLSLNKEQVVNPFIKLIDKQQLVKDSNLLEEVFGLLIQAHYQTRPSDLRDILDAPGFKLFALFNGVKNQPTLLAACLISDEGPIWDGDTGDTTHTLQQDIFNGLRRPKGHLIPQVLAHHMGLIQALTLRGARIVRIATLPNLQQHNLGSELLSSLIERLKNEQYDYLGSSYADTQDVRNFWVKNRFKRVRIGNKQDAASGTHSALVIQGLSPQGVKLETAADAIFSSAKKQICEFNELTENEAQLLNAFLTHRGSYENAKQLLARFKNWDMPFPKKASKEFKQEVSSWLNQQRQLEILRK